MKDMRKTARVIGLIMTVALLLAAGCGNHNRTGTIQGAVTIGPVFPGPALPGDTRPVPADVFSTRKVVIYDSTGKNVIQSIEIKQVGQTAIGYYVARVKAGTYIIDIMKNGIDRAAGLPRTVTVVPDQTTIVDIDIDTGIR